MSGNIDTFNQVMLKFLDQLTDVFPDYAFIKSYRSVILGLTKQDPGFCLDTFMEHAKPHGDLIMNRDDRIFEVFSRKHSILKALNLESLWKSEISDKTRHAIWEYIASLYVIGSCVKPEDIENSRTTNMDFSPDKLDKMLSMFDTKGGPNPLAEVAKMIDPELMGKIMNPETMNDLSQALEAQLGDGKGGIDETKLLGMFDSPGNENPLAEMLKDGNPFMEAIEKLTSNPEILNGIQNTVAQLTAGATEDMGDGDVDEGDLMNMLGPMMKSISGVFKNLKKIN